MQPQHPCYLISYDITDARRLRRLHRHVQREAFQVLESLYLLSAPASHVQRLWQTLRNICDPATDQLQFLPIDQRFALILGGTAQPPSDLLQLGWPAWQSLDDFLRAPVRP